MPAVISAGRHLADLRAAEDRCGPSSVIPITIRSNETDWVKMWADLKNQYGALYDSAPLARGLLSAPKITLQDAQRIIAKYKELILDATELSTGETIHATIMVEDIERDTLRYRPTHIPNATIDNPVDFWADLKDVSRWISGRAAVPSPPQLITEAVGEAACEAGQKVGNAAGDFFGPVVVGALIVGGMFVLGSVLSRSGGSRRRSVAGLGQDDDGYEVANPPFLDDPLNQQMVIGAVGGVVASAVGKRLGGAKRDNLAAEAFSWVPMTLGAVAGGVAGVIGGSAGINATGTRVTPGIRRGVLKIGALSGGAGFLSGQLMAGLAEGKPAAEAVLRFTGAAVGGAVGAFIWPVD